MKSYLAIIKLAPVIYCSLSAHILILQDGSPEEAEEERRHSNNDKSSTTPHPHPLHGNGRRMASFCQ
jgi:hypothetical protein